MKDKNFYSSDMESLNRTVGRVFTNFDPVSGSKTLFKSHRQEVFIFQQSMYGSFHFERKFVNNKDFAYLGRHFLKLLILHPLGYARICLSEVEATSIVLQGDEKINKWNQTYSIPTSSNNSSFKFRLFR